MYNGDIHYLIEGLSEEQLLRQLEPAEKAFYDPNNACTPGTREPLLSQIKNWLSSMDDDSPQLFWLHGPDGSGKTSVASSIATELDSQNFLSCCFFYKRENLELCEPDVLLPTLSYQLTRWHDPYRKKVLRVLMGSDRAKLDAKNLQWQFELLFERPLKQIQSGNNSDVPPRPLLIIIDGLDVCAEGPIPVSDIAALLARMASLVPWLRVFVASQLDLDIQDGFNQMEYRRMDMNDFPAEDDIEKYTKAWITKLPRLDPIWYDDERIKALSEKACGRFIWASDARKYVTDPKRRDKNRAMDKILAMQSFDASRDASRETVAEHVQDETDAIEAAALADL